VAYGAVGVVLGGLGCAVGSGELGAPTAWVAFVLAAGLAALRVSARRLGERWGVIQADLQAQANA